MAVTSAMLLLVVTSMLTLFAVAQRSTVRQTARSQTADDIRLVMNRMTKEIRQAEAVRSGSGPALLDFDTFVDGVATRIIYSVDGTTLTKTVGSTTLTVLERLTDLTPFCCALDLDPSTVIVTLEAKPEHFQTDVGVVSLTSEIKLRNRG